MKKIYYLIIILICFSAFLLAVFSIFHNDNDVLVKNSTIKEGIKIEEGDSIILEEGLHRISDNLVIPEGKTLIIKPGANLKIAKEKKIIVNGKIIAKGTENNPIIFEGDGDYWRGIIIEGNNENPDLEKYKEYLRNEDFENSDFLPFLKNGNIFIYCEFRNLITDGRKDVLNREKAVLEVNNTTLIVSHSKFEDIIQMGCIQTKNTLLLVSHNEFLSKMVMKIIHAMNTVLVVHNNEFVPRRYEYQTWPDGIYTNTGVGVIAYNNFEGLSDDAIDFDNSFAYIIDNNIKEIYDDGLDIDNGTEAYIIGNVIDRVNEHGILISSKAKVVLSNNSVSSAENGIALRNGGSVFVDNLFLKNNNQGILLFERVPLILTVENFNLVREKFLNITEEEMDYWGFYEIKSGKDAVRLFENSYDLYQNYMILKTEVILQDLKNLFKIVEVLEYQNDIEEIYEKLNNRKKEILLNHRNSIYISNSIIETENPIKLSPMHFFEINNTKINGTETQLQSFDFGEKEFWEEDKIIKDAKAVNFYTENLIKKMDKLVDSL